MKKTTWLIMLSRTVSAVILAFLLARLDWAAFWSAVTDISPDLLALAAVINLAGLVTRAFRWNVVAGRSLDHYWHFWRSTIIGYLGNFIYPLRAGELLRVLALNRLGGVPVGQAVTSSTVDRVCDGIMLAIAVAVVAAMHSLDALGMKFSVSIIGVFLMLAVAVTAFIMRGKALGPLVNWIAAKLPENLGAMAQNIYAEALEAAAVLRQPSRLSALVVINGAIAGLDFLFIWCLMFAFGWDLPFLASVTVLVFLLAGSSLPSGPGYIGVYQLACILALSLYGVDQSPAIAYATVLQLVILGVLVTQGAWSVFRYGVGLRIGPKEETSCVDSQQR